LIGALVVRLVDRFVDSHATSSLTDIDARLPAGGVAVRRTEIPADQPID
jgi:hypothetical protein